MTCIADNSALTLDEALFRLKNAGLDSIPGGGAEILVDEVRSSISPKKIGWKQWGEVMLKAARLGMPTTATMMFGSSENPEDIVEHLFRVREIQDQGDRSRRLFPGRTNPAIPNWGNRRHGGRLSEGAGVVADRTG